MSLLLPDSGLLFWMMISFGIVFFVVAKWGFPLITRMAEERKEYIDKSLQAADEANRLLAQVNARSEALVEEAHEKQRSILRDAAQIKEQIVSDAKDIAQRETQKMVEEARKHINAEREAVLEQMRGEVALLAIGIAEQILRSELKEKDHHSELVNRLLDEAVHEKLGQRPQ